MRLDYTELDVLAPDKQASINFFFLFSSHYMFKLINNLFFYLSCSCIFKMYKNDEGIMNMMAISPNKSCDGLPDILSNPEANIPVGYVLLYPVFPNRPKYFQKRSTSDIKYKKRIYSGSRFFWRTG